MDTAINDAVLALISLGYKQVEAHKAIKQTLQTRRGWPAAPSRGSRAPGVENPRLRKSGEQGGGEIPNDHATRNARAFASPATRMTTSAPPAGDLARIDAVRRAFPAEGLFLEKEWLLSPRAFPLSNRFVDELEKLGYRLHLFQRACNLLYQLSVKGKQPAWVARYLDAGKPPELVALSRERIFRDEIARIIRPDIIPTENGLTIAELDTVPGGIGLTAWFNRTYAALGDDVVGGRDGMLEGFASIFPGGASSSARKPARTVPRWSG